MTFDFIFFEAQLQHNTISRPSGCALFRAAQAHSDGATSADFSLAIGGLELVVAAAARRSLLALQSVAGEIADEATVRRVTTAAIPASVALVDGVVLVAGLLLLLLVHLALVATTAAAHVGGTLLVAVGSDWAGAVAVGAAVVTRVGTTVLRRSEVLLTRVPVVVVVVEVARGTTTHS